MSQVITTRGAIPAEQLGRTLPHEHVMVDFAGACDQGYSCAYESTLCWSGPTSPLPIRGKETPTPTPKPTPS